MSSPLFTLVEARTRQLELRKRLVRSLDDLGATVADDGERDALLIVGANAAAPEDSALLRALEAFEMSKDSAACAKYLKDTRVIVLEAVGDFDLEIGQLKAELRKAPSVLFVTAPRARRMANLHLMYGSFHRALVTPPGPLAGRGRGESAPPASVAPSRPASERAREERVAATSNAPADAARTRRNELLEAERWLSSQAVAELARGATVESNPYEFASRLRRERRLFGARFRGSYYYPEFQFVSVTGEPHAAMADLIPLLPGSHDGWTAALWLFEPTGHLDGARPADVFQQDPAVVVDAARKDFHSDDGDW